MYTEEVGGWVLQCPACFSWGTLTLAQLLGNEAIACSCGLVDERDWAHCAQLITPHQTVFLGTYEQYIDTVGPVSCPAKLSYSDYVIAQCSLTRPTLSRGHDTAHRDARNKFMWLDATDDPAKSPDETAAYTSVLLRSCVAHLTIRMLLITMGYDPDKGLAA